MKRLNSQDRRRTAGIALFVAAFACLQLPRVCAQAQTLLTEAFESYAPGTFPAGGGWVVRLIDGVGDPAAQVLDNTVSASGTNSLRLVGGTCADVGAYRPLSRPNRFRLEASVLVRDLASGGCWPWAGGVGAITLGGSPYGAVLLHTNGWLYANCSSNVDDVVQLVPFTTDAWCRVGMTIDLDQRRFDVDVNGLHCGTSLAMSSNGLPTGIEMISSAGTAWYDDIAVFVPTNGSWLQIYTAVEMLFQTELYKSYQFQYSDALDATNWFNLGAPFVGAGVQQSLFQSTRGTPHRFYRLLELGCAYVLSTNALHFNASESAQTVQLLTSAGCPWTVSNPCASWLTVTPANGLGGTNLTVQVANNGAPGRSCTVTIGGQALTVTQDGFSWGFVP